MEYTPARRRRAGHVLGGPRVKYGLCLEEGFAVKGNHPHQGGQRPVEGVQPVYPVEADELEGEHRAQFVEVLALTNHRM